MSVTNDNTNNSENILINIVTSSSLVTTSTYRILLKTHTGVDP
jgi:hypothetical protein